MEMRERALCEIAHRRHVQATNNLAAHEEIVKFNRARGLAEMKTLEMAILKEDGDR
jgi:hypothetical protein